MESLTVIDQIHMVCDDKQAVDDVLKKLAIDGLKKYPIKSLSLGQKRRVQLVCALLESSDYLICDEVTASQNKNIAEIIMKELKHRSESQCILLTSDEEAFITNYADVIFSLKNKTLEKELHLNVTAPMKKKQPITTLKKNSTVKMALKLLQARLLETVYRCTLCVLLVLSMCGGALFIIHMSGSQRQKDTWYYEDNVIMSLPKSYHDFRYEVYDTYDQRDLNQIKESCPGIIGYEWGWYIDLYLTFADEDERRKGYDFHPFLMETLGKIYYQEEATENSETMERYAYPFPMFSHIGLDPVYYGKEHRFHRHFAVFQMFDWEQISLMIGNYPSTDNEAVIDALAGEYLCEHLKVDQIENLIGLELSFYTYPNEYYVEGLVENTRYSVKISGITDLVSQRNARIYTNTGAYDRFLADSYQFQSEYPEHMFMNLLTDKHRITALMKINQILESDKNSFVWSKDDTGYLVLETEKRVHQNPTTIYGFFIGLYVVLVFTMLLMEWILHQRNVKEQRILYRYNYHKTAIQLIQLLFYYMVAFVAIAFLYQQNIPGLQEIFSQVDELSLALICVCHMMVHMGIITVMASRTRHICTTHD